MADNTEQTSHAALVQIVGLLSKLNDHHVWKLINTIRDECNVLIPVWFTNTLVQEITEELGVTLSYEQAQEVIETVNDNDSAYSLGRNLVEELIIHSLPTSDESESDTDSKNESDSEDK